MGFQKNIVGLIFDFDGTIFDLDVDWVLLNQTLREKFGIESSADASSFPPNEYAEILSVIEKFELRGVETGKPITNAPAVLHKLADHYKIAIMSRNNRRSVAAGLVKMGFDKQVVIVAREDVQKPKPDPEALQLTLNKLGLTPEQVIVIGDTTHDLEAAKALGIICIIIKNPKLKFQPENADYYIDSLEELSLIIDNIRNIRRRA